MEEVAREYRQYDADNRQYVAPAGVPIMANAIPSAQAAPRPMTFKDFMPAARKATRPMHTPMCTDLSREWKPLMPAPVTRPPVCWPARQTVQGQSQNGVASQTQPQIITTALPAQTTTRQLIGEERAGGRFRAAVLAVQAAVAFQAAPALTASQNWVKVSNPHSPNVGPPRTTSAGWTLL